MAFRSLTIVLPAYNEEARLDPALDELFGYLHRRGPRARDGVPGSAELPPAVRVLVVDDGSADRTREIVRARPETAERVEVDGESLPVLELLTVPHGGKGAAVRAGMLAARAEAIVFADADMATPPDELVPLVRALEDADVALGSRIQPDGSDMRKSQPPWRRFLGKAFHLLASIWVVGPVQDTQCGFKGFRREAAHDVFARQRITSIVFDVELIYLVRRRGYQFAVVPIHWADRRGSRMHPGPRLALRVAWDLFRIPLLHRGMGRARRAEGRTGAARVEHADPAEPEQAEVAAPPADPAPRADHAEPQPAEVDAPREDPADPEPADGRARPGAR
jgi:dolichyl-phosphate beta-glucosyltransferase